MAPYPQITHFEHWKDVNMEASFQDVLDIIHNVRSMRKEHNIPPDQQGAIILCTNDASLSKLLVQHEADIKIHCKASSVQVTPTPPTVRLARILNHRCTLFLDLPQVDPQGEWDKTNKKLQKLLDTLNVVKQKMEAPNYMLVPSAIQSKDK